MGISPLAGIGSAGISPTAGIGSAGLSPERAITLTDAVVSDITSTTITITATSSGDLSSAVFGVEYKVLDNGGDLTGYTFAKNTAGAAANQSITFGAAEGVTADSTVTVRAYYNLDVLDPSDSRVYANDIVPVVVAGDVPSGTQTAGETLTQVQGIIAGSSPITVTYQWQNDGGTGTWGNISGATSATYVLQASDVNKDVAVVHTGTNSVGSDNARSAETGAIQSGEIQMLFWGIGSHSVSASSTDYTLPGSQTANATESIRQIVINKAMTLQNFAVAIRTAQPATGTLVATVRKNGVDTALTVTFAAGAGASSQIDSSNTVAFAAGDLLSVSLANGASTGSGAISGWMIESA